MPSAKKQLKNKQNKSNLKNHDSLKKAYALKNNEDFNPNKYHDLSNIIESGDYGLDVLGNTVSDQVIPAKLINFANQTQDNTKSEWVNGANMGLELLKNTSPFIADLGINTLQKLTTHLGNKNPEGIDRAYKNYFNNEKGPKYTNGGNLNRVKFDPIRIQKNKQIQKENKDLNFVSRIEDPSLTFPDSQGNPMTHYMASADDIVFPTVVQQHGNNNVSRLGYEEAYKYANKSGEYIKFPSEKDAIDYGINYKQGTKLEEFNNGGYIKKLKYNKKGTYPTYEFPPMAFGGWLDNLPNEYSEGGSLGDDPTKPYHAVTNPDGYKTTTEKRTLLNTASQFIPVYEQILDYKDVIDGVAEADLEKLNRGAIGMIAPFAGKALMNSFDYLSEKGIGKEKTDINAKKRNDIVNMGQGDKEQLFINYGHGGYDKWAAEGYPDLYNKYAKEIKPGKSINSIKKKNGGWLDNL